MYCGIYLFVFMAEAISFCFMMTYLISLGYSTMQRSAVFSVTALAGIFGQIGIGYHCDRRHYLKPMVFVTFIIYAAANAGYYLYPGRSFVVHLLLAVATGASMRISEGLLDSWVLESNADCRSHYGMIRAQGSLGWAIGSPIAASIVQHAGYPFLGAGFAIVTAIHLTLACFVPEAHKVVRSSYLTVKDVEKLLSGRRFRLIVEILFFMFIVAMTCDYAVIDKMNTLKASAAAISWSWSIQAIVEIPLFLAGDRLAERFGMMGLLRFAAVALGVRYLLYGLAVNVTQMVMIAGMQFFTFGIMTIAAKRLVDQQTPPELKTSGQQLAMALYNGGSLLCAPLLSGGLETAWGVNAALLTVGAITVIPLGLSIYYSRLPKDDRTRSDMTGQERRAR